MGNPREKNPWAEKFSVAIHTWLKENHLSGADLARQLGIAYSQWNTATTGSRITVPEFYARVFCHTNLPEADPRTMPLMLRGHLPPVERAMSEEAWQEWLSMYGETCGEDSDLAMAMATEALTQDVVEAWPDVLAKPGNSVEQEELDSIFGDFDVVKFEQTLLLLKRQMRTVLTATPRQQAALLEKFGQQLGRLYSLLGVLTIEDPEDRKIAVSAQLRWSDSSDK